MRRSRSERHSMWLWHVHFACCGCRAASAASAVDVSSACFARGCFAAVASSSFWLPCVLAALMLPCPLATCQASCVFLPLHLASITGELCRLLPRPCLVLLQATFCTTQLLVCRRCPGWQLAGVLTARAHAFLLPRVPQACH